MSQINDIIIVLKGMSKIMEAAVKSNSNQLRYACKNSTWKNIPQDLISGVQGSTMQKNPNVKYVLTEFVERLNVIVAGLQTYIAPVQRSAQSTANPLPKTDIEELNTKFDSIFDISNFDKFMNENSRRESEKLKRNISNTDTFAVKESISNQTANHYHTTAADLGRESTLKANVVEEDHKETVIVDHLKTIDLKTLNITEQIKPIRATTSKARPKVKQTLSETSRQRAVPASRIGRLFAFGSLAAGLGVGTATEFAKSTIKSFGRSSNEPESNSGLFLSPANAERIVDTLCKVRGAALKLGQLLSLQDEAVISPELQKIFERVRQSADFMPKRQVEQMLASELGTNWRGKFGSFEDKPFAAASIGQVHLATLQDGSEVAVKIQYPGVAQGINSDIDNLVSVLNVWNVFPEGLFIDNIVEVAKKELAWEVNYVREAECTRKFKKLLEPYPGYYIPSVADELCSRQVLTTELIEGLPLDKCLELDIEVRERIAHKVMKLCLLEMFVFRCMQTDPNWSNFFYNKNDDTLVLLDFGATREYSKEFMDKYIQIIKAASDSDSDKVLSMSRELKFLTGYESKLMEQAHVETVMIMAEVFNPKGGAKFDFSVQSTTKKLHKLVPTILAHRLCPPPEEIYSLHRKLSGVFLLFSKLKVKMDCKDMFRDIYDNYQFDKLLHND